ncbi:PASTA domain-containing protein [Tropicibacter oceani]|uniref:PASTA domain-containing protein n=1 Tax=Tropicibacter oceani TaxID=3058420 RepID=A0ABY8QHX1_9RHOB|nr:PASTA domain-containing protein [Tropicibacter oceani]WGW04215.1 PASTA domain-containing protein [Tropicibacter oceani]
MAQSLLEQVDQDTCVFVPDDRQLARLAGQPRATVERLKECTGMELVKIRITEQPDCVRAGHIVSAGMAPLADPPSWPTLNVVVSSQRIAPDFTGKSYRETSLELRRCGLAAEFLPRAVLVGAIVQTVPPAGTPIEDDTEMLIWTAGGTILPDVTGSTIEAARATLAEKGFEVGTIVDQRVNLPEWQRLGRYSCSYVRGVRGKVLSTRPAAGSTIVFAPVQDERAKITLTVESLPELEPIPELCPSDGSIPK